jgi:hypothetical protein
LAAKTTLATAIQQDTSLSTDRGSHAQANAGQLLSSDSREALEGTYVRDTAQRVGMR